MLLGKIKKGMTITVNSPEGEIDVAFLAGFPDYANPCILACMVCEDGAYPLAVPSARHPHAVDRGHAWLDPTRPAERLVIGALVDGGYARRVDGPKRRPLDAIGEYSLTDDFWAMCGRLPRSAMKVYGAS